jgi:hypothetical protein
MDAMLTFSPQAKNARREARVNTTLDLALPPGDTRCLSGGRVMHETWKTVKQSAVLFLLVLVGGCNGMDVTIENGGDTALESAQLHVRGNTYKLGDIPAGESVSRAISVEGESHIEVVSNKGKRLVINVYMEPGYEGSVEAEVTPDSVLSVRDDITVPQLF